MRTPEYLSPTSLRAFESNRREAYLRYLADYKPPRFPQTRPMSVGSAFDAYCKSYLHKLIFGDYGADDGYKLEVIFEKQVESHNRTWAWEAGKHTFELYKKSGALADLMLELGTAIGKPRFEFEIKSFIRGAAGDVPLLGKPDIYFINAEGARIILDWKVNGFCASTMTSPYKGFVMVRDSWLPSQRKPGTRNRMAHKDCYPTLYKGIRINPTMTMEQCDEEWAAQLVTYAWLLGEEVGSTDIVLGIEQLCGVPDKPDMPWIRCASHRYKTTAAFQYTLLARYEAVWDRIKSGIIFDEPNSLEIQAELEEQAKTLATQDPNSFEAFCAQLSRG